jgi:hypothetical protein
VADDLLAGGLSDRCPRTALSFVFNITRYVVALTTFFAGALAVSLGGVAPAATLIGLIYILGLFIAPFAGPETKGAPLPA